MNLTRSSPWLPLALLLAALVAWQAAGLGPGSAPVTLAAIRMDTLVESLDERANAKAEVDRMERDVSEEQKSRQAEITKLEDEYKDLLGTAKEERRDLIALKRLQYQSWLQGSNEELEAEKAIRLQDLYRKIKLAIKGLAEASGYDIVIQNDESMDLPFESDSRVPAQVQVLQQVSSRKVLYVRPQGVDVTQDLIVRMNNEFRAAGANPPARKNP